MNLTWLAFAATSFCVACAGRGLDQPIAQFPSKDDLRRVAARPAKSIAQFHAAAADRWQIETPIPAPTAPYPIENAWDRMLTGPRPSAVRLAPELRCAATETARFFVANGGYPEDALRQYLLLRCGSTLATTSVRMLSSTVSDDTPDSKIEAGLAPSARELIAHQLSSGKEVGLGFARGNGRASLVAFSGTPLGHVQGIPSIVHGDTVTLDGDVAFDVATVLGLAAQGAFGVALCEADPSVKLPAFRLTCPMAEQDLQTPIEIVTRKPNQVLMHLNTQLMVRRSVDAGLLYEAQSFGAPEGAANVDAFRSALVGGLNEARTRAGARPLQLEASQSRDTDQLVSSISRAPSAAMSRMRTPWPLGSWPVGTWAARSAMGAFSQGSCRARGARDGG
jgi:hypothetical protein